MSEQKEDSAHHKTLSGSKHLLTSNVTNLTSHFRTSTYVPTVSY